MNNRNEDPEGRVLKVSSSKNQCRGCGWYFKNNSAFEKHRTGRLGYTTKEGTYVPSTRRCMSPEEMVIAGLIQTEEGYWNLPMPEKYLAKLKERNNGR